MTLVKNEGMKATSFDFIVCWFRGAGVRVLTSILPYPKIGIHPLPAARRSPEPAGRIDPIALLMSLQTWTSAPDSRIKLLRGGNSSFLPNVVKIEAKL